MARIYEEKHSKVFHHPVNKKKLQSGKKEYGHRWRGCGNCLITFTFLGDCAIIQPYWLEAVAEIKLIFGSEINNDFSVIYLGKSKKNMLSRNDKYLIILVAASKRP